MCSPGGAVTVSSSPKGLGFFSKLLQHLQHLQPTAPNTVPFSSFRPPTIYSAAPANPATLCSCHRFYKLLQILQSPKALYNLLQIFKPFIASNTCSSYSSCNVLLHLQLLSFVQPPGAPATAAYLKRISLLPVYRSKQYLHGDACQTKTDMYTGIDESHNGSCRHFQPFDSGC